MKTVVYRNSRGPSAETTVRNAIKHALQPDPYSYDGAVEKAELRAENAANMLAKLIDHLYEQGQITDSFLEDLLPGEFQLLDPEEV